MESCFVRNVGTARSCMNPRMVIQPPHLLAVGCASQAFLQTLAEWECCVLQIETKITDQNVIGIKHNA
jgi:hypothetical protein